MVTQTRRETERGAALFVVVLVITLLTTIGVFAARASSLVEVATGNNRQAVQTIYLADYGQRSALALIEPACDAVRKQLDKSEALCQTNWRKPVVAGSKTGCFVLDSEEMSASMGEPVLVPQDEQHEGSLGPRIDAPTGGLDWTLQGLWRTEVVEGVEQAPNELRVTVTTFAQIRNGTGNWCGSADSMAAASVHAVRSHVVFDCLR